MLSRNTYVYHTVFSLLRVSFTLWYIDECILYIDLLFFFMRIFFYFPEVGERLSGLLSAGDPCFGLDF